MSEIVIKMRGKMRTPNTDSLYYFVDSSENRTEDVELSIISEDTVNTPYSTLEHAVSASSSKLSLTSNDGIVKVDLGTIRLNAEVFSSESEFPDFHSFLRMIHGESYDFEFYINGNLFYLTEGALSSVNEKNVEFRLNDYSSKYGEIGKRWVASDTELNSVYILMSFFSNYASVPLVLNDNALTYNTFLALPYSIRIASAIELDEENEYIFVMRPEDHRRFVYDGASTIQQYRCASGRNNFNLGVALLNRYWGTISDNINVFRLNYTGLITTPSHSKYYFMTDNIAFNGMRSYELLHATWEEDRYLNYATWTDRIRNSEYFTTESGPYGSSNNILVNDNITSINYGITDGLYGAIYFKCYTASDSLASSTFSGSFDIRTNVDISLHIAKAKQIGRVYGIVDKVELTRVYDNVYYNQGLDTTTSSTESKYVSGSVPLLKIYDDGVDVTDNIIDVGSGDFGFIELSASPVGVLTASGVSNFGKSYKENIEGVIKEFNRDDNYNVNIHSYSLRSDINMFQYDVGNIQKTGIDAPVSYIQGTDDTFLDVIAEISNSCGLVSNYQQDKTKSVYGADIVVYDKNILGLYSEYIHHKEQVYNQPIYEVIFDVNDYYLADSIEYDKEYTEAGQYGDVTYTYNNNPFTLFEASDGTISTFKVFKEDGKDKFKIILKDISLYTLNAKMRLLEDNWISSGATDSGVTATLSDPSGISFWGSSGYTHISLKPSTAKYGLYDGYKNMHSTEFLNSVDALEIDPSSIKVLSIKRGNFASLYRMNIKYLNRLASTIRKNYPNNNDKLVDYEYRMGYFIPSIKNNVFEMMSFVLNSYIINDNLPVLEIEFYELNYEYTVGRLLWTYMPDFSSYCYMQIDSISFDFNNNSMIAHCRTLMFKSGFYGRDILVVKGDEIIYGDADFGRFSSILTDTIEYGRASEVPTIIVDDGRSN